MRIRQSEKKIIFLNNKSMIKLNFKEDLKFNEWKKYDWEIIKNPSHADTEKWTKLDHMIWRFGTQHHHTKKAESNFRQLDTENH